jgi:hypothetical protein
LLKGRDPSVVELGDAIRVGRRKRVGFDGVARRGDVGRTEFEEILGMCVEGNGRAIRRDASGRRVDGPGARRRARRGKGRRAGEGMSRRRGLRSTVRESRARGGRAE